MKIALIASHAWPIPNAARTGDTYVLDLAKALDALGHDVALYAPEGTAFGKLRPVGCAQGKYTPTVHEHATLGQYKDELGHFDIVHDLSTSKVIGHRLGAFGLPVCMTLTGGPWTDAIPPKQLCVFSNAQRDRVLRGATDYEGSPTPDAGGPKGYPVNDARVVYAGVDTAFYHPPLDAKNDYALWLNRWHPVKGYELAIRIAKETGLKLVMAGVAPQDTTNDYERRCALEAQSLASGVANIDFRWLPGDDPKHDLVKRDLYQHAAALLYPVQFQEPFGLSMVEAMACGTPVIGTRMGSVPEIVADGVTGAVVNMDASIVEKFAAGMVAAYSGAFSQQDCRRRALERFSAHAMALRYVAVYQHVIAGERW